VILKPAEYPEITSEQEQRIERQLAAGQRGFVIATVICAGWRGPPKIL
jgi:hypothetical protein